jgi:hypothetical protein
MYMTRERIVAGRRLSYGDYLLFPDDSNRHESVDGALPIARLFGR